MSFLSDERKVRRFIENDEPCPTELILGYYLKCKRHGTQVPEKIEAFIDAILKKIVQDRNHGYNPNFNDIFGFKNIVGGEMSKLAIENRALLVGIDIETLKDEGKLHKEAIEIVPKKRGLGVEVVKKAYTEYKKINHSLDGLDTEGCED
jgi:hypothetical protein